MGEVGCAVNADPSRLWNGQKGLAPLNSAAADLNSKIDYLEWALDFLPDFHR